MSWRTVVITQRAKLDLKLGYLVVRGETTVRIHLSEIGTLIVETTAASLTTALLCELIKRKVKVIFCDEQRNPSSELLPYYGSHDTSGKVRQQVKWSEQTKRIVWTEIVTEKIRKQSNLLLLKEKPERAMLEQYIAEIRPGDETNREGHAAKVYFNSLFGREFTRTAENSINAALNYGYSILLSSVNREIVANGYITQLGLFHGNQFNCFNFASDLMEPFRPLIDKKVVEMMPQEFSHEEKMAMVAVLNDYIFIEGKHQTVSNGIKVYCRSVFDALNENDIANIRFYTNEL